MEGEKCPSSCCSSCNAFGNSVCDSLVTSNSSTLNDCVNRCQEREKTLAVEVQKDRDQQWKLIHRLKVLEQREQDREIRIALQEDQIQMLQ